MPGSGVGEGERGRGEDRKRRGLVVQETWRQLLSQQGADNLNIPTHKQSSNLGADVAPSCVSR